MPKTMFSMQTSGSSATMTRPEITENTCTETLAQTTESVHPATLQKKGKPKKALIKKPDTKVLSSTHDERYLSSDEASDSRDGGRKTLPLLLKVSRNCQTVDGKKLVRCIGSVGCGKTWIRPRDKTRILKHVMSCGFVANLPGGSLLVQDRQKTSQRSRVIEGPVGLVPMAARTLQWLKPLLLSKPSAVSAHLHNTTAPQYLCSYNSKLT